MKAVRKMKISYRHNVMNINSIDTFLNVKGGYNHNLRDVYFVRGIGEPADMKELMLSIDKRMDDISKTGRLSYVRLSGLPGLSSRDDADFYAGVYEKWEKGSGLELKCCKTNPALGDAITGATRDVASLYKEIKPGSTGSMEKNFVVKLWFWLDSLFEEALSSWSEKSCIKVLADNVVRVQEYLFYYMLTLLGCDVFLLESKKDIQAEDKLVKLSATVNLGEYGTTDVPAYIKRQEAPPVSGAQGAGLPAMEQRTVINSAPENERTNSREKSFEELARLASSIVMIAVHDQAGNVMGTGSGIMIGRDGYILTNHHVVCGGRFFSVRIEDDTQIYRTDEVIKYNTVLDMAVIRIDRTLKPIPIYNGAQKLVRGQKVVAIGSPLGMFNSVSDGIISGFRRIDERDMIQFTAPTSPGSSGGAVLNMQGEVIGISTAGIDNAQNINLAVGYENIRIFARGFF